MPCVRCGTKLTYLNRDGERECSWCGHVQYKSEPLGYIGREHKFDTPLLCTAIALHREGWSWNAVSKQVGMADGGIRRAAQLHMAMCEKCGG